MAAHRLLGVARGPPDGWDQMAWILKGFPAPFPQPRGSRTHCEHKSSARASRPRRATKKMWIARGEFFIKAKSLRLDWFY